MKLNKFFAVAMATLALVACVKPGDKPNGGDEPDQPGKEADLVLSETSKSIEIDETFDLTANVAAEFTVNKEDIVQLVPANDGKSVKVTGVGEGSVILTATTKGGQTKTCVVKVAKKEDPTQPAGSLKGSQIWPIILDGDAYAANESKIVASFQPNDVDQFLYVWPDGTSYVGGDGEGLNSLGNTGYTALVVGTLGWSGAGFCLTDAGNGWEAAKALNDAIVANPDQYALHLAIKSTDDQAHTFYWMGSDATKVVIGKEAFDGGKVIGDFPRDGGWHEFDIEMAEFASALASADVKAGVNVFCLLSGGNAGRQLNLDAVYFYKK